MAFVFHRRLAIPLWAVAFVTVAFTAPPTATFQMPPATVFAIAGVGIAAIVWLMPGAIAGVRASRSLVRVVPSECRHPASARIVGTASTAVRPLDESNATDADDALDLIRMDDDGGLRWAASVATKQSGDRQPPWHW